MDEPELRDDLTIMDLDKYSDAELIDCIFFHYKQNIHSYFIARFIADTNFRLLLYTGWIFITVENNHLHLVEFLKSQNYAMHTCGSKSSVYAFYADNRELDISNFGILKEFLRVVKYIKQIDIESHNIIFRRCKPQSLRNLCLSKIQAHNLRPNFSQDVLEKLGCIDIS
ncbi:hypothetical protein TNIN_181471 [Trichonephila inaurata madagascariensis]|uniref:Uncharacterized protein n=1 Tax=Trichonephila inaurata madagascariensis TaxID=2747483 RepID=A0A8X6YEC1_9ARAC|nr:hypothetical protein TNIN_386561 [Trichonephila inaurata madagascariensis]GFY69118.1 hypothetical protein TNIN_181471 [Trichonephila inaurata madagascariensis]